MTSDVTDEQTSLQIANQAVSTLNKINSVGKLVGNKLLDISKKIIVPSTMPIQQSSNEIESSPEKSLSKFYLADNLEDNQKINENQEGLETNFDTNEDSIINNDVLSSSPVNSSKIINENSVFYPNLSKKQFINKHIKLNYLRNYIKDSKTVFIFII